MKSKLLLTYFLFTLISSCTKNKNPEPTFPVNSHRIKEIKGANNEIFTYEGEFLVNHVTEQYVGDLVETYTYNDNIITSTSNGHWYRDMKEVIELDGNKLKKLDVFSIYEDNTIKPYSSAEVFYEGEFIKTIVEKSFTGVETFDSYEYNFIYERNQIKQYSIELITDTGKIKEYAIIFDYENDVLTSHKEYHENSNGEWENYYYVEYTIQNSQIWAKKLFDLVQDSWRLVGNYSYKYNENGYLVESIYNGETSTYVYEEGNGNASIVNLRYFLRHSDLGPYYKSGNLNSNTQSELSHQIIQQILQSQMGK